MAAAKFVVGIAIGSLALISEALHSSVDLVATVITWLVVRVSDRPADDEHHYGHGKLESLSALGVIAMLYVLAGGILVEAYGRLREGAPPPTLSAIPFVVLLVDIAVNLWRARALHRTARDTKSQALAADALHFASDVLGSVAVIIGLALSGLGYAWGDAAAAIGVAVMISAAGLAAGALHRRNPARPRARRRCRRKPPPRSGRCPAWSMSSGCGCGWSGRPTSSTPSCRCRAPIRSTASTRSSARRRRPSADALDDADLTFTAVPVARDNESVRERIMVIARNSGLAIHHVTVHDLGGKLTVSIDLEVDGEMALAAAHDIAQDLERSIRDEFGDDVEVDTHIEPLEPELPLGTDAAPDRVDAIRTALSGFAADGAIHDIHNVRVRDTDAGEIVNFHCRAAPSMSVIKVHENVDEIERALAPRISDREARHQSRRAGQRLKLFARLIAPFPFETHAADVRPAFPFRTHLVFTSRLGNCIGQDLFCINELLTLDRTEKTGFKSQ